MSSCNIIIVTFIITCLYDVILRKSSENYNSLPVYFQYDFIRYLIPYFKSQTLLSAALAAGFVGATTQAIILNFNKLPNNKGSLLQFLIVTFVISALYGFIMKWSKLFPDLENTYYKNLGTLRSMYHDGISGVIVQITILTMIHWGHYTLNYIYII